MHAKGTHDDAGAGKPGKDDKKKGKDAKGGKKGAVCKACPGVSLGRGSALGLPQGWPQHLVTTSTGNIKLGIEPGKINVKKGGKTGRKTYQNRRHQKWCCSNRDKP